MREIGREGTSGIAARCCCLTQGWLGYFRADQSSGTNRDSTIFILSSSEFEGLAHLESMSVG